MKSFGTICLCVFLLLYGLGHVTNVQVVWMDPITGFAAIAAAILLVLGK